MGGGFLTAEASEGWVLVHVDALGPWASPHPGWALTGISHLGQPWVAGGSSLPDWMPSGIALQPWGWLS